MKQIEVRNIQPKSYKRGGQVYQPKQDANTEYNADILPGKSIRIFGKYGNHVKGPQSFDRTFNVGDIVEYGSYNLSYTGEITRIGAKTVTVKDHRETRQLDLDTFCWRNWDLDLEEIAKRNAAWSD